MLWKGWKYPGSVGKALGSCCSGSSKRAIAGLLGACSGARAEAGCALQMVHKISCAGSWYPCSHTAGCEVTAKFLLNRRLSQFLTKKRVQQRKCSQTSGLEWKQRPSEEQKGWAGRGTRGTAAGTDGSGCAGGSVCPAGLGLCQAGPGAAPGRTCPSREGPGRQGARWPRRGTGVGRGRVAGAAPPQPGCADLTAAPPAASHKSSPERNQEHALPHPFNKSVL